MNAPTASAAGSPDPRDRQINGPRLNPFLAACFLSIASWSVFASVATANSPSSDWNRPVTIDVPPVVMANRVVSAGSDWHHRRVEIELRVSTLLTRVETPRLQRLQIDVVPRSANWSAIDYLPRTLSATDIEGPIEVSRSDEQATKFSGTVDGSYGQLVTAHLGGSRDTKTAQTTHFHRHPERQTVTAAGTIARGRGVRFSFRASATQPLEGERTLRIIFEVPRQSRGELIDVSVSAIGQAAPGHWTDLSPIALPTLDDAPAPMAQRQFIVAVVPAGDHEARAVATELVHAERCLAGRAHDLANQNRPSGITALVRQVTARIDPATDTDWLARLLAGTADPYFDPAIRRLPTELRVLALDYNDLRQEFMSL